MTAIFKPEERCLDWGLDWLHFSHGGGGDSVLTL